MSKYSFVAVIISLFFFSFLNEKKEIITLSIGDKAPMTDYKMKSVSGDEVSIADFNKENGYLVIFSCNTCPYVIGGKSFPGWEKDYNTINDWASNAKVGVVLVNSNEAKRKEGDGFKDMKKRAKEKGYKIPYVLDEKHKLADAFGAKTTPHVFLFDNEHNLIFEGSIDDSWNLNEEKKQDFLKNALDDIANGRDIKINKSSPKGCSIKRIKK